MDGLFITFEGTEGSGKTTQIRLLGEKLREAKFEVVQLREPGGTPLGEEIRDLLKHKPASRNISSEAELLLINAARAQLVREVIRPALARGAVVISDRFHDSSIAYQAFGRELPLRQVEDIIQFAIGELRPHLTLFLDVPLAVSEQRRSARDLDETAKGPDRFETSDRTFFERVEQGYRAIAENGGTRVRSIDATQPLEKVAAEVWRWVEQILKTPMAPGEREFKSVGEYRNQGPG